ncbi:HAD hydrolase-like protein [Geofilum rubicundum]|uniref:Phosphoglycolate phosphatase n=1 Tax=Geofilum rubicundum JCM 15548 TaxID=1236989 RepID=A0A0E9LXE6_9BACT|nr:HAD hydrolase-like protein [Geofilum rubicundum]GAO29963.1 hypothetical protein JCM15548_12200 [Geofilum rubicundum JCM 15548]
MKIKLVIFDLDGTLLDSVEDMAASTNFALQQMGHPTTCKQLQLVCGKWHCQTL